MPEILTESFCERCGTRYTFESAAPKGARLKGIKVMSRGLRNFVMSDDTSMDEAMAAARNETDREATSQQLDAFHKTFNFCMSCRQYTCGNCWNEIEGRCLSCAPNLGQEVLPAPFPNVATAHGLIGDTLIGDTLNGHEQPEAPPLEPMAWPTSDLMREEEAASITFEEVVASHPGDAAAEEDEAFDPLARLSFLDAITPEPAAPPIAEPEPAQPSIEPEPVVVEEHEPLFAGEPESEPAAAAEAEPQPIVEAEREPIIAPEPAPIVEPVPEPVSMAEPEPAVEREPEPAFMAEPEPAVEAEPEPVFMAEPEPAVEREPEPAFMAEPEPEPNFAGEPLGELEPPVFGDRAAAAAAQTTDLFNRFRPGQNLDDAIAAYELNQAAADALADEPAEREPERVAEPVAAAPEPVVVEPEPEPAPSPAEAIAAPEPVAVEPEPEPVAMAPEPMAAPQPVPAPAPEPVAAAPEAPASAEPEQPAAPAPVAAPAPPPAPEPVAAEAPFALPTTPDLDRVAASASPTPAEQPGGVPASWEPVAAEGREDVVPQPTWQIVAPDTTEEPQWPSQPAWPSAGESDGLPFFGRPAQPTGGIEALWAESAREVASAATVVTPPLAGAPIKPAGGVQPCVSCGLSLSANARFCRRCGTRQD
jgi:hypothetical protein